MKKWIEAFGVVAVILVASVAFAGMTVTKISDTTVTVTKEVASNISLDQLLAQQKQLTMQITNMQSQLDDLNSIIKQAQDAGVMTVAQKQASLKTPINNATGTTGQ